MPDWKWMSRGALRRCGGCTVLRVIPIGFEVIASHAHSNTSAPVCPFYSFPQAFAMDYARHGRDQALGK